MDELMKLLGKVAPWIAAAATGPAGLAGMAIKTAAEALGASSADVCDVTAALAGATPEQLAALKLAELNFKLRMQELGFKQEADLAKIAADDRASARGANVQGGTTRHIFWLSVLLLTVSLGSECYVLFVGLSSTVPEIVAGRVLGLLDAIALTVMAYWYGTTDNSSRKTELLAQSAPAR